MVWVCECDCGNTISVPGILLTTGGTQSCGCLQREILVKRNSTHGESKTRLYRVWKGMHSRCNNPHHKSYKNYGGRGIKVCREWSDFACFEQWAKDSGYDEDAAYGDCTLDRLDVDADYSPQNCRWADAETQANNTRLVKKITYNGLTKTAGEWAKETGINKGALIARIDKQHWSVEQALTTPVRKCRKTGS